MRRTRIDDWRRILHSPCGAARAASHGAAEALRAVLARDPRVTQHPLPDAPGPAYNFSVGEEEFIAGTSERVERAIPLLRAAGV